MSSQSGLRDAFLKKYPYIRYGLGHWRQYEVGIWAAISNYVVERNLQELIQKSGAKLSHGLVTSVAKLLEAQTYIPDALFDSNPYVLTFRNCCLSLIDYQLIPHSPEYYSTLKLNYDYDPTAKSVAWERAVASFPDANVLQRFAGLSLTTDTKYEVALWLHGPPGGGKSTFIAGLEAMLGPKCCVLGLEDVTSRFGLSHLPGKTLAVSTEQPANFIKCSHKLNAIISGESLQVEQKYAHAFSINPKVKLLWAMNELPMIPSGAGAGLFRRVFPIYWPSIDESSRDPMIKEDIMRSGMAVANWAIEGLKRLREAGRFEFPQSVIQARNEYRQSNDLTQCFVDDCCRQDDDAEVGGNDLYKAYREWCDQNGHHPVASNRLTAELQKLGFEKDRNSVRRYWRGLELLEDFPEFIVEKDPPTPKKA